MALFNFSRCSMNAARNAARNAALRLAVLLMLATTLGCGPASQDGKPPAQATAPPPVADTPQVKSPVAPDSVSKPADITPQDDADARLRAAKAQADADIERERQLAQLRVQAEEDKAERTKFKEMKARILRWKTAKPYLDDLIAALEANKAAADKWRTSVCDPRLSVLVAEAERPLAKRPPRVAEFQALSARAHSPATAEDELRKLSRTVQTSAKAKMFELLSKQQIDPKDPSKGRKDKSSDELEENFPEEAPLIEPLKSRANALGEITTRIKLDQAALDKLLAALPVAAKDAKFDPSQLEGRDGAFARAFIESGKCPVVATLDAAVAPKLFGKGTSTPELWATERLRCSQAGRPLMLLSHVQQIVGVNPQGRAVTMADREIALHAELYYGGQAPPDLDSDAWMKLRDEYLEGLSEVVRVYPGALIQTPSEYQKQRKAAALPPSVLSNGTDSVVDVLRRGINGKDGKKYGPDAYEKLK